MMNIVTFRSVQQKIKMPPIAKIQSAESLFPGKGNDLIRSVMPQQLRNKLLGVNQDLLNCFFEYQNPKNFQFKFPESKFQPLNPGEVNSISYERRIIAEQENTFRDRLTSEQIEQISQKGTFQVKSNQKLARIPYTWKVNQWIVLGSQNVRKGWEDKLYCIYQLFSSAFKSITARIPEQVIDLVSIPKRLFALFFGLKKLSTVYTPDYQKRVASDFFDMVYNQNNQANWVGWGPQFWKYLFTNYKSVLVQKDLQAFNQQCTLRNNRIQTIYTIDNEFNNKWQLVRNKIIKQVQKRSEGQEVMDRASEREAMINKDKKKEDKIFTEVSQRKFTMYLQHLSQTLPKNGFHPELIQNIISLSRLFYFVSLQVSQMGKLQTKLYEKIRKELIEQYPIRSKSYEFLEQKVQERYNQQNSILQKNFRTNLQNNVEFKKLTSFQQQKVYKQYLQFKEDFDRNVEMKKDQIKPLVIPYKFFYTTRYVLPPYEVIKNTAVHANPTYTLQREIQNVTSTKYYFWKFWLFGVRIKCWTINCFVFFIYQAFLGPMGLRCLFGIDDFAYDENVDYYTGNKTQAKRSTVLGHFIEVLNGIGRSRADFENKPDLGLFGKNCSRICNLMECYIFRFLIVGVFLVLILYPIAILLMFFVSSVIALTVWLWVPLCCVFVYLFNILIYQFDSASDAECTRRIFPIFMLMLQVVKCIFLIFVFMFHFLITPILSIIVFVFTVLWRIFRTIMDKFMQCMMSCCARTPSIDTCVAWKIAGPGMTNSYYMSLDSQHVYILTQAQLQVMYMRKFNEITQKKIIQPRQLYKSVMQQFLKPYVESVNHSYNRIFTNCDQLTNNFRRQYQVYMNRYPRHPYNVRFTQQQIENYFQNCMMIVKNFLDKTGIHQWIYKENKIEQGNYEELTKLIWINLFGIGQQIFEPLQELDTRFKLQDLDEEKHFSTMNIKVNSVMRALEGQVKLNKYVPGLAKFTPKSLDINPPIFNLYYLCSLHSSNHQNMVSLNKLSNEDSCFVPHLNIKQAIKADNLYYQSLIAAHKDNLIEQ